MDKRPSLANSPEFHLHPGKGAAEAGTGVVVGAILGGPVAALIGGALGTAFAAAVGSKHPARPEPRARSAHRRKARRKRSG